MKGCVAWGIRCMRKAAVFSGTKEGQELCRKLCERGVAVTFFAENEDRQEQIQSDQYVTVRKGKLSSRDLEAILGAYEVIIDATHTYSSHMASDIQNACKKIGKPYLRVQCESLHFNHGIYVDTMEEAADYLNYNEGNALLAIGSRNLELFRQVRSYKERLTVHVMPTIDEILACNMAGFTGKQIIAMEETCSALLYQVQLQEIRAVYLVVKEENAESFMKKAEAARLAGAELIVIQKSFIERGKTVEDTIDLALQFLYINEW